MLFPITRRDSQYSKPAGLPDLRESRMDSRASSSIILFIIDIYYYNHQSHVLA